jgi:hypothetical protein
VPIRDVKLLATDSVFMFVPEFKPICGEVAMIWTWIRSVDKNSFVYQLSIGTE